MNQELQEAMISLFQETSNKRLQKKSYLDDIENFRIRYQPLFQELAKVLEETPDTREMLAEILPTYGLTLLEQIPSKRKREIACVGYNLNMVAYILPLLGEMQTAYAHAFCEEIVAGWNGKIPDAKITVTTVSEIEDGFKKNLCYITTAVCQGLNKGDDCYELSLFRAYRDDYLLQTEEGKQMVAAYYNVAPTIVKRIRRQGDAVFTFQGIWDTYLKPCVRLIEQKEHDAFKNLYYEMVNELEKEFLH